jgi:hypothetical protein
MGKNDFLSPKAIGNRIKVGSLLCATFNAGATADSAPRPAASGGRSKSHRQRGGRGELARVRHGGIEHV